MALTRKEKLIEGRRLGPAGHALITGLIALGLATLLNAPSLLETAERQPLGRTRSLAVGVMDPIAGLSDMLFLDRPRKLVDEALGRGPEPPAARGEPILIQPDDDPPPGTTSAATDSTTTPVTDPITTTIPPPPPQTREITADAPLGVWIIGDSFVELFGPALRNDIADTGVAEAEVDFRFISGLVRFDYFDWPAHIQDRLPEIGADAVVVMFGGNDGQPMEVDGRELEPDTSEWLELYAGLVGEAMDTMVAGTTRVYWVGLPIMRDERFTERTRGFNAVYAAEAAQRPSVTFVDTFDLFKDSDGEYSRYLRTDSGDLREMRTEDGAHFTWNGAYRLSEFVLETIAAEWDFEEHL
jgi:hypothetical protein